MVLDIILIRIVPMRTREKEILMFDKVGLFKKERPKRIMIISMMA